MARTTIRSEDITDGQVKAADIASGAVSAFDDSNIKNDIALLGFKIATNHSLAQYTLDDQIINEFTSDTDGIDAGASTNESYTSGYWFGGTIGTGGDDTSTVVLIHGDETVTAGDFTANGTNFGTSITASFVGSQSDFSTGQAKFGSKSMYFDGTGDYITIPSASHMDLVTGTPNFTIDMWMYKQNTDEERFIDGGAGSDGINFNLNPDTGTEPSGRFEGTWSWSGGSRNHNTSSAGDGGFTLNTWHHYCFTCNGSSLSTKIYVDGVHLDTQTGGGQGVPQLAWQIGGGGGKEWTGYIDEFRFSKGVIRTEDSTDPLYITTGTDFTPPTVPYSGTVAGNDLTLQSTATTAVSAPTKGDLILLYSDEEGTATLNTDLKGYISRDGTNFTEVTLTSEGAHGSQKIAVAHDVTISSASGTSMKWKITTHNQSAGSKETFIHAVSLGWS